MSDRVNRVPFTEKMKEEYTILIPMMLPIHFELIANVLGVYGYKVEVLKNSGDRIKQNGLKYVHNDTCYPALIMIGQMIDALQSGKYDPHKVALLITQTGGGCRASNYLSLLRKAIAKAGYEYVPVISLNFVGLEKNPGFRLTPLLVRRLLYAILFGDLLMLLQNCCLPYETESGATDRACRKWIEKATDLISAKKLSYRNVKRMYGDIVNDFASIELSDKKKVKVGIVGEIFVKFSPAANNNLEEFLINENAEVVMPGLLDFCLFIVYNMKMDWKLYGIGFKDALIAALLDSYFLGKQRDMIDAVKMCGKFREPTPFSHTRTLAKDYIGYGAKMGEGWLLTAEMIELIEQGVDNIVCAQPFGCLPNHIMGKGMMKPIKDRNPDVNIVAIDYDSSASKINQENRIKLMLANAKQKSERSAVT